MISQIKFVSIPVTDQQRDLEFYTEKLGFIVKTDAPMGEGMRWLELQIPGAETRVVLFTAPGQEDLIGRWAPVVWGCKDVQKTFEELTARGVTFTQGPKKEDWGMSAFFVDPDANTFLLSSD